MIVSYRTSTHFYLALLAFFTQSFLTNAQSCSSTVSGDTSTYTVSVGTCSSVTCIDDYDCSISCGQHACSIPIIAPNTDYSLDITCSDANACQRATIIGRDNSNGDISIDCGGGLYSCEQTTMISTTSGTLNLDCTFDKTCEHFELIAGSNDNDFLNINLLCDSAHSCYNFYINSTGHTVAASFTNGNINIECSGDNSCQNSNFEAPYYGAFTIDCTGSLSCAGGNLNIIANNDDINNEVINSYVNGYGTFNCQGSFSCQGSTIYCPNYKDCSITCDESQSCDQTIIYCPKFGGDCNINCINGDTSCNGVVMYTYNENDNIINGGDISITDTDVELDEPVVTVGEGGGTSGGGIDSGDSDSSGSGGSNANDASGGVGDSGGSFVIGM